MTELVKSPLPGKVVEYYVQEGDVVSPGDTLVIVEAMKMLNEITSDKAGVVTKLIAPTDEYISVNADLVELKID